MEKRKGRFVIDDKIMQVGTEIYREIVDKMLSVHIAYIERKMRSCLQCPSVCAPVAPRQLKQNPYTSQYKGKKFLPQHMLPTYLLNALTDAQRHTARDRNNIRLPLPEGTQRRIRRRAEQAERDLDRAGGDADRAVQNRRDLNDQELIRRVWDMRDRSDATNLDTRHWDMGGYGDDSKRNDDWSRVENVVNVGEFRARRLREDLARGPVEDLRGDASAEIPDVSARPRGRIPAFLPRRSRSRSARPPQRCRYR